MTYSRKTEHTSTGRPAKPLQSGPEHTKPDGISANKRKTNQTTSFCEGRGADGQPALLAAALLYAERGRPVFPLHSVDGEGVCSCGGPKVNPKCKPGKHPRTPNGHISATTAPGKIKRWWRLWPNANIGIPTGERSGLLVLDVDHPAGVEVLEEEYGPLPATRTHATGSGGMHVLFCYPESGERFGNSSGSLPAGFDIRGEGGYIVAPPSRTTRPYEVLDRLPLTDPPEWLLQALRKPQRTRTADAGDRLAETTSPDGAPIPEGTRNGALASIAGGLRARGAELAELETKLLEINAARCEPPLPEAEVLAVARSVSRYAAGDAAPEPEPDVLEDVEALFTHVLEARTWTGRRGPTKHAAYAALLFLARRHGRRARNGGVKVYVSERQWAELAGTSRTTIRESALPGLRKDGLVYRSSEGRGKKAGAIVLRVPHTWSTQPHGGGSTGSGPALRDVLRDLLRLRWGAGRAGKVCAVLLSVARFGELTISELCERTGRRRDNVRRSLNKLEARGLVECSDEVVRLVEDFRDALRAELEVTGILRAERLQRERHEREREGYQRALSERRRERVRLRVSGFISELEPLGRVEASPEPERESVESTGKFAPDALITDATDPAQFRELAAVLRTGPAPADNRPALLRIHRARRNARRLHRKLDRERGGYERRRDGARMSPASFLRSELRGVSGMGYPEMLRRWKAMGGEAETLDGAISAGPYRIKREPMDFNRPYVYPAVLRSERAEQGAA